MSKISRRHFVQTVSAASVAACATPGSTASDTKTALEPGGPTPFRSDWQRLPDRYWTGPATWANPWEDWQVQQGRLVCTHPGKGNRTVHCLTHQLNAAQATAEIQVTIEYCGTQAPTETGSGTVAQIGTSAAADVLGSAGFELGIRVKDPIDDYRSRLLFGLGQLMGINGQGELFIGRRHRQTFPELATALAAGEPVRLKCTLCPASKPDLYSVALTAERPAVAGGKIYSITTDTIPAEKLVGNIALVNNLPPKTANTPPAGLYAFSNWTITGPKITAAIDQQFGPILWTLYTLSNRILKLTAQMPPLGDADEKNVELQVESGTGWETIASATIDPLAATATFRVPGWDDTRDIPYRVAWTQIDNDGDRELFTYAGTIRRDPKDKPELVVGGYCCFFDFMFPNTAVVEQTRQVDPDIMFFMGDQIYEGVGGFGIIREGDLQRMVVNYLRKLALLGWSIRDLTKDRPTVWMPDDHDVYHGNLWGAGGRKITLEEWRSPSGYRGTPCYGAKGGYVQPAEFVRAVERTQTAHLPDPYDPTPVAQGIGVYYTALNYGRVSFAILEDRKFKSGPMQVLQHDGNRADWITDPAAAQAADVPGAELLGPRQETFLRHWIGDWENVQMKMAVMQTILCNAATHHGGPAQFLVADMDSNGWPASGRNKALDILRRGAAFMLGGDQHLPTVIHHGIDRDRDAGVSFCVPAGAVCYQRWWRPEEIDSLTRTGPRHDDRPHTGVYRDGFGNRIDVLAVANPTIKKTHKNRVQMGYQRSSGFGVVRIHKEFGTFTLEAWPVTVDPAQPMADQPQYPGWPATVTIDDCAGPSNPTLPSVVLENWSQATRPVVQVCNPAGETVAMARMTGTQFTPRVPDRDQVYSVTVLLPEASDPAQRIIKRFANVRSTEADEIRPALMIP